MNRNEFRQWIYENHNVPGNNCTLPPDMLEVILGYVRSLVSEARNHFFTTVFPSLPGDVLRQVAY